MIQSPEGIRRVPAQARSRLRQDHILQVAETRVVEVGSDALRMSDLAERAGISIGSLYQYFRDKNAILAALAERYHEESTACIRDELSSAETPEELVKAFDQLIDTYFQMFLSRPAMRDVWTAIEASKALHDIEHEASRRNGALLAQALAKITGQTHFDELAISTFAIMALGEATMRLAVALNVEEGRELVATYKRMARTELKACLQSEMAVAFPDQS